MSENAFPFRRLTDPLLVPVAATPTQFPVPLRYFGPDGPAKDSGAFMAVNKTRFCIRLRGSGKMTRDGAVSGDFVAVDGSKGWCFPPGVWGPFTTQLPRYLSCMFEEWGGATPSSELTGNLELVYGNGL